MLLLGVVLLLTVEFWRGVLVLDLLTVELLFLLEAEELRLTAEVADVLLLTDEFLLESTELLLLIPSVLLDAIDLLVVVPLILLVASLAAEDLLL